MLRAFQIDCRGRDVRVAQLCRKRYASVRRDKRVRMVPRSLPGQLIGKPMCQKIKRVQFKRTIDNSSGVFLMKLFEQREFSRYNISRNKQFIPDKLRHDKPYKTTLSIIVRVPSFISTQPLNGANSARHFARTQRINGIPNVDHPRVNDNKSRARA